MSEAIQLGDLVKDPKVLADHFRHRKSTIANLRSVGVDQFALDSALQALVTWIISELVTALPFLSIPVIGPFLQMILGPVLTQVLTWLEKWFQVNFVNQIVVNGQVDAFNSAKSELEKVQTNPQATDADVKKANEDFQNSFKNLIHFSA